MMVSVSGRRTIGEFWGNLEQLGGETLELRIQREEIEIRGSSEVAGP